VFENRGENAEVDTPTLDLLARAVGTTVFGMKRLFV